MADYVLSAKGTYDGSGFDSGIEGSKSKLSGFMDAAKSVAGKVKSALGDAFVGAADTITSSIGTIGAGIATIAATGGISRALNMEKAKTMFRGLQLQWGDYEATISDAVDGTAFSMDAAALVAANLAASGVSAGESMERSLNGATGVAATFGADLADIGGIYQKVAAQGKLSGEQLAQLSDRGINGLSVLAEYLGKTQSEVREMVTSGQIDFQTFSDAMYDTFGESAKGANDTFSGVTANIRSNIAKIGEIFATPALSGLQRVFAALLPVIKSVRSMLTPLSESFAQWVEGVVPKAVSFLERLKDTIDGFGGDLSKIPSWVKVAAAAIGVLSIGSMGGLISQIPIVGGALGGLFGQLGKLATPVGSLTRMLGGLKGGFAAVTAGMSGPMVAALAGVIALVVAMVAAFADLMVTNEGFRSTVTGLVGEIGSALAPAFQSLLGLQEPAKALFESVKNVVAQLVPAFLSLVAAVAPVVSTIVSSVVPVIGTLMGILGSLLEQLAGLVTPAIQAVADFVAEIMPQVQSIITSAMEVIHAVIQNVWPRIQSIVTAAMGVIQSVMRTVWPVIKSIVTAAMNVIQAVIDTVMAAINGDWQGVWEGIKSIALAIWNGIKSIISTAITAVMQNVGNVLNSIKALWDAIWGAISSFLSAIWNGIKSIVSGAANAVHSTISSTLSAIQGAWSAAWGAVQSAASAAWNGIKSIVSGAAGAVSGFVSGLVSSVTGFFSNLHGSITSAASSMWGSVQSAFSSGVSGAISAVQGLPGQIKGLFSGAGSWLIDSGRSIINGLVSGIQGAIGSAVSAVSGAVGRIRSLFPFSPAKEGPFSGKGWVLYSGMSIMDAMGEGAEKRARKTVDAYRGIAGRLRDSLELGDVSYGLSVDTSDLDLPVVSYGNSVANDRGYGVEDTLGGLYGEVAELRSTLGRTIAENAPVVVESEREANRRYRRAAYA